MNDVPTGADPTDPDDIPTPKRAVIKVGSDILLIAIALYESAVRCRREVFMERKEYLPVQIHWRALDEPTKDRWLNEARLELDRATFAG